MGRKNKLLIRLLNKPKDFTFDEPTTLLGGFGYELSNAGSTSGSSVKFINRETKHIIRLHKPHPSPILKEYLVKYIIGELKIGGYLDE
jgi:hypothetical protein